MDLGGYWARHWSDCHVNHEWKILSLTSVFIASQHISVVSERSSGFFSSIAENQLITAGISGINFSDFVFIYWFSPRIIPRLCNKPCFIRNLQ